MSEASPDSILAQLPRQDAITAQASLLEGEPVPLNARRITEKTCKVYDYIATTYLGQPAQAACYRDANGLISAQHVRRQGKQFSWVGRVKGQKIQLFGQHLGSTGRLIIAEGEIDAMSIYQTLCEFSPYLKEAVTVVSIQDGAASAKRSVSEQLLWIGGFDSVVLFFDTDEVGKDAAIACAEVIGGKALIVQTFPYHDANDALKAEDGKAIRDALLSARRYRPEAAVHATDLLSGVFSKDRAAGIEFPWVGWNELTHGIKPGQLMLLAAGTKIGKSAVARSLSLDFAKRGIKNAYIALEEDCGETIDRMLSEELGYNPPFYLDNQGERARRDPKEITQAFNAFAPSLFLLDKHIDSTFESVMATARHFVEGEGCQVIFLDHFSLLADSIPLNTDQRRGIDKAIKDLKSLCVHCKFAMVVVCHLSRIQGGGLSPEEGGEPQLYMLRGSNSLMQVPDFVVMLQRNPNSEDPIERSLLKCHMKANRVTGINGLMSTLHYLPSCRFFEVPTPSHHA